MSEQNAALYAFNRGLVSPLALARMDVKRLAFSAEDMQNWAPRVMGGMMLRPGLGYITSTYQNKKNRDLPFIKATDDTAIIELTDLVMRVQKDDAMVSRVAVTTTIANPTMAASLASWTDVDEAGGASAYNATGHMELLGTGTAAAAREQQVSVSGANVGAQHALRITIFRGPVTLRVGSSSGGAQYIAETTLGTGTHSLTLTPTADFYIRFQSRLNRTVYVYDCDIEAAGVMTLPTPWPEASLGKVRADTESQSADVLFLACEGYQQRRIERRDNGSWSIVLYTTEDGPFRVENSGPITLTPSALNGNITVSASAALFYATQVGALFQLRSTGQTVTRGLVALNDATSSIQVTGVGTDRAMTVVLSGFTAGRTIQLQRSFDDTIWTNYVSYAADTTTSVNDGLDNQIVYYRLQLTVLGAAGTTQATLSIPTGTISGVVRITGYTNETTVSAEVLSDLGSVAATTTWSEGEWSDYRGWPTCGTFTESRCCWAGKNGIWASITDAFSSFDIATEGDSGPISRTIGSGPIDVINWMLPLSQLILGPQGKEVACRSSSLEEPLTPTNFNIKPVSTQGSSAVQPVKIDDRGVFVDRSGSRVYELSQGNYAKYDATDLTVLIPEIGEPKIVRMSVQRKPDTRILAVRSDGTMAMAVQDRAESVLCWCEVVSDGAGGLIEDVVVLPAILGTKDDQVYLTIARTIGGTTVRYREKMAQESEAIGGTVNKQADAFVTFTNSPASATVGGLGHLIGATVVAWYDGKCPVDDSDPDDPEAIRTFVVNGAGEITLPEAASTGMVGLAYSAPYRSAKLGWLSNSKGTALLQQKNINQIGLVMRNVHPKGLKYGPSFDSLSDLPSVEQGAVIDQDTIRASYDEQSFEFGGEWDTDSRVCLLANAPRPATVLAAVLSVEMSE